jgi:hypothetical protein
MIQNSTHKVPTQFHTLGGSNPVQFYIQKAVPVLVQVLSHAAVDLLLVQDLGQAVVHLLLLVQVLNQAVVDPSGADPQPGCSRPSWCRSSATQQAPVLIQDQDLLLTSSKMEAQFKHCYFTTVLMNLYLQLQ